MEYRLYAYWRSSCSWRVRIVLSIKHIQYSVEPVNLLEGKQRESEYSQKNFMRQVPTLMVGEDFSLTQSLAIMRYLESQHPEPSMLPSDPFVLAKMWEVCEVINSGTQPLQNVSVIKRINDIGGDGKQWAKEYIEKGLSSVENIISNYSKTYSFEDYPTLADACILPQVYNARRFEIDMNLFPRCQEIAERLMQIPEVVESSPDQQPDKPSS